jgi:hypothetical protein
MSETNITDQNEQTSPAAKSTQLPVRLFFTILMSILLPAAAFPQESNTLNRSAGWALSQGTAPAANFDKAGFTLFPELRSSGVPLLLDRRSLLAQTINAPAPAAANSNLPTPVPAWGTEKSYSIPALEIVGFDVLLNLFDRAYFGCCDYDVDLSSIKRNLRRGWNEDRDEFTVNQLGHPYQGSMYHGFARASGLNSGKV